MIGIICAMDKEVDALKEHLENERKEIYYDIELTEGKISGQDVVIALCGVGKVNAAMTTALLIQKFQLEAIINVGVAGGLLSSQEVLDMIIARRVIQHDFDISGLEGDEGLGLESTCDEELGKRFKEIVDQSDATAWIGDIASGDVFVTKTNYFDRIRSYFPSCVCADMEAGAISSVCNRMKVKCLVIRSLSDVAAKEGNPMDYLTFVSIASKRAGDFCADLLKTW